MGARLGGDERQGATASTMIVLAVAVIILTTAVWRLDSRVDHLEAESREQSTVIDTLVADMAAQVESLDRAKAFCEKMEWCSATDDAEVQP